MQATAGLDRDLLNTRYQRYGEVIDAPWLQPKPEPFELIRTWRDVEGLTHTMHAWGRLSCEPPQARELPLATLELEACSLTLDWDDGSTTDGTLWRAPASRHLWAVEEQIWPDGPNVSWEVARQWW